MTYTTELRGEDKKGKKSKPGDANRTEEGQTQSLQGRRTVASNACRGCLETRKKGLYEWKEKVDWGALDNVGSERTQLGEERQLAG